MKKIAFIDDCVENPSNPDRKYHNVDMLKENPKYAMSRYKENLKIIEGLRKHHAVTTYNSLIYAGNLFRMYSVDFDYIITNSPPNWDNGDINNSKEKDYSRSIYHLRKIKQILDSEIVVFSGASEDVFNEIKLLNISNFLRRKPNRIDENIEKLLEMIK